MTCHERTKLNFIGCKLSGFVGSVASLAEIWSLSAVSFDRFKGVLYPLNNEKRITKSQVNFESFLIVCEYLHKCNILF